MNMPPLTLCETCDYIKQRKDDMSSISGPASLCPTVQGLLDAAPTDRAAFVW